MPKNRWIAVVAVFVLLFAAPLAAAAQEHPEHPEESHEHPEEGQEQEHPEHPEEGAERAELTKEQLADAIEGHIADEADSGGLYVLDDPETGETLHLELDKVHEERLSKVAESTYFACVDFVGQDGTLYDVDFFMKGESAGDLEYDDFSIHKVNGVERYTWYEEGGVWKKRPVGGGGGYGSR